jgi:hypothetical protein
VVGHGLDQQGVSNCRLWLIANRADRRFLVAPLVQGPPPQATESANRTAEADKKSDGFDYTRLRSYINSAAGYCTSERPNAPSEWRKKFICESKITDAVIAGLTFFLMIFTGLLVWVGNKQERTTRRQMRAFVYLDRGSIYNVASPINPLPIYRPTGAEVVSPFEGPLAQLTIKNTGSTPAYRVEHWGNIFVSDFPLQQPLPSAKNTNKAPTSAIAPGGINTKSVKIAQRLTDAEIAGIRTGTMAIWVYGEIIYWDAFKRKRTTHYRLFHNSTSGAIGVSNDLTWAEDGNEAD